MPYFKQKLNGREQIIINYLTTKQNKFISTKQISRETGLDYKSTREVLNSLYDGMLIHKKVKKFYPCAQTGGKRFETLFKVDLMTISCLPIHHKKNKNNSIMNDLKNDKNLIKQLFNFEGEKNG